MSLQGQYQNAYVTHDIDAAIELWDDRLGTSGWIRFEPDMMLKTPHGERHAQLRAALSWKGGLQLELIQPIAGYVDDYRTALPSDPGDFIPRFHHIAVRRDDESAMRQEALALGLPVAFEGAVPGLQFIYVDARVTLGHYLEFVSATPEMWIATGWPEGRPTT